MVVLGLKNYQSGNAVLITFLYKSMLLVEKDVENEIHNSAFIPSKNIYGVSTMCQALYQGRQIHRSTNLHIYV